MHEPDRDERAQAGGRHIDYAISKIDAVNGFLCQDVDEKFDFDTSIDMLIHLFD